MSTEAEKLEEGNISPTLVNLDEEIEDHDLFAELSDEVPTPREQVTYEDYFYFTTLGWVRIISIVVFIVVVSAVTFVFSDQVFNGLDKLLEYIQSLGIFGVAVFSLLFILTTIFFIPSFVLSLSAGFLYHYWGIPINIISSTIGSVVAFFIGKMLLRQDVVSKLNGSAKFQAIDRAIKQNGFKIILLLRLIPITPFNFLNYVLGVTNISPLSFIAATLLGMTPEVLILVHLGTFAKNIKSIVQGKSGPSWGIELISYLGSAILVFCVFCFIIWIAKRELKNSLTFEEELEQHNQHLEMIDDEEEEEEEDVDIDKFSKKDDE
eukprot:gene2363-2831_t